MSYNLYTLKWTDYSSGDLLMNKINDILSENNLTDYYTVWTSGNQVGINQKRDQNAKYSMADDTCLQLTKASSSYRTAAVYSNSHITSSTSDTRTRIWFQDYPNYYSFLVSDKAILFSGHSDSVVTHFRAGLFFFPDTENGDRICGGVGDSSYYQRGMVAQETKSIPNRNTYNFSHFSIIPFAAYDRPTVSDKVFQVLYSPFQSRPTNFVRVTFNGHQYVLFGDNLALKVS